MIEFVYRTSNAETEGLIRYLSFEFLGYDDDDDDEVEHGQIHKTLDDAKKYISDGNRGYVFKVKLEISND